MIAALAHALSRRPGGPLKATVALTSRCNLRCQICHQWRKPPEQEMNTGELACLFAGAGDLLWLSLTGGEVFLRRDIADIARVIADHCPRLRALSIPTNGYETELITGTSAGLAELFPGRLFITVSIDGPQPLHDRLRGREGSWDRAVATYSRLKSIPGLTVYASMTLSPHNIHAVEPTLDALRQAVPGFDARRDMNFNVAHVSPHFYGNTGMPAPEPPALAQAVRTARKILFHRFSMKGFLQHSYLSHYLKYMASGRSPLPCAALRLSCFINPRGVVYPCHAYDLPLGSLRETSFDLKCIWNDDRTRITAAQCRAGRCPGCWSPCEAYPAIVGALHKTALAYFFATI